MRSTFRKRTRAKLCNRAAKAWQKRNFIWSGDHATQQDAHTKRNLAKLQRNPFLAARYHAEANLIELAVNKRMWRGTRLHLNQINGGI